MIVFLTSKFIKKIYITIFWRSSKTGKANMKIIVLHVLTSFTEKITTDCFSVWVQVVWS